MKNENESSCKHMHHFNIRLLYVADIIEHSNVTNKYYLTNKIIVDYMAKSLVESKFIIFWNLIMNLNGIHHSKVRQ